MVGLTLGHYRLLEQVGQGGMATVYRARDLSLDRECAVKVLHRHLQGDKESRLRFQREAQAVARLRDENILEIYAYSVDEGQESFLVTEFIQGPTLRAELLTHPPRFAEIGALIGSEVARALIVAHREGVIHRDIKPENIMIRANGTIVLCDFGIARVLDKDTVTTTGQLLGSPAYMAPEHIKGQSVDSRSDLFSLGTLMYELVTGELPFAGKNPHDTLTRIAAGTHTPLCEQAPLCSSPIGRVIERAMAVEPDARYQDADLLREDLLASLRDSGIEDARAELSAYFRDPAAWEAAFAPKLKTRLIESGRALRKSGRLAGALAAWDRAQQLDPADPEVGALLASLSRGNRRRRLARYAVGVAAICVIGGVAGHRLRHRPHSSTPPVVPTVDGAAPVHLSRISPTAAVPAKESVLPPLAPPIAPSPATLAPPIDATVHPAPPRMRPSVVSPAPALHMVRLEPWPKAVQVIHNGRRLGAYGMDVRTVQLATGRNEFIFENPACYSERVLLPQGVMPEEVRVRLRWKPALLLVNAVGTSSSDATVKEPLIADVLIDGKLVGRSGQVAALPMQGDDGSRAIDVQISAPGHRTVTRSLSIHANQLSQLDLTLPQM